MFLLRFQISKNVLCFVKTSVFILSFRILLSQGKTTTVISKYQCLYNVNKILELYFPFPIVYALHCEIDFALSQVCETLLQSGKLQIY